MKMTSPLMAKGERLRQDACGGGHASRAELHGGPRQARSHCRFVLPLDHFAPDTLRESMPLVLTRHRDRTLGPRQLHLRAAGLPAVVPGPARQWRTDTLSHRRLECLAMGRKVIFVITCKDSVMSLYCETLMKSLMKYTGRGWHA